MRKSPLSRVSSAAGFTLIELMITIVIATVLLTIAIPSYQSQIRKSRRTEAKTALLDLAAREERYLSTNSAYTTSNAGLGYTFVFPQTVGSGYYQISICVANAALPCAGGAVTGNVFALTATAVSTQAKDTQCATFTVDSTGVQTATGTDAANCWK